MDVPVTEAKAHLTELIRRAEGGEEVRLTRHGHPVVRLVPVGVRPAASERRVLMEALRDSARSKALPGADAARSQDFLYDGEGMPR